MCDGGGAFLYFVEGNGAQVRVMRRLRGAHAPKQQIDANTNIQFLEKETSIQINKYWIKDESFKINKYCVRQGWNMITTKSGVSYMITKKGEGLVNPKVGDLITLDYDVRLLDADQTLCTIWDFPPFFWHRLKTRGFSKIDFAL